MYTSHYNTVLNDIFPEKEESVTLNYTDTDSFIYSIKTPNVYQKMHQHAQHFDFSGYPVDHPCKQNNPYLDVNKKCIGKFKDEVDSAPIKEFVGLRSKVYSMTIYQNYEHLLAGKLPLRRCKGVQKSAINRHTTHQLYKHHLQSRDQCTVTFNRLQSKRHLISTVTQKSIAYRAMAISGGF